MSFVYRDLLKMNRPSFRLDEVAWACGVSLRSVQRWIRRGAVPVVVVPGKGRRIPRAYLLAASPTYLARMI